MTPLLPQYTYECILVNDGSRDRSEDACRQLCTNDPCVIFLNLSRNFGQSNAIMAGFHAATGDYIIGLDDDLQTPPEEAPKLIQAIEKHNYDVVYGRCVKKQVGYRNLGSRLNALMTVMMINKPPDLEISSYFIARRYVVEKAMQYSNPYPYLLGLFLGITRNIGNVDVEHMPRKEGRSNYTLGKLMLKWMDGLINFSVKPLRVASMTGFAISVASFLLLATLIVQKILMPHIQMGWTSIIAVILFLGGLQLVALGLLGEYVGRTYLCINGAPQFIVKEQISGGNDQK
jgi:undecaprenyl-phosphate 4-deoxy-4-formamido-L-arabinose transferase